MSTIPLPPVSLDELEEEQQEGSTSTTLTRPAYEPASGELSLKRSAPCEELKYTITWSLTDKELTLTLTLGQVCQCDIPLCLLQ